jgi:Fic family protein
VFIHERDDRPRFRWDEDALSTALADVRHRRGLLIGRMEGLGFRLREEAVLDTLTQDVVRSSEIEGEALDREQVRSSIARRLGMDVGALIPADRDVEGVVETALDATQRYAEPLTEDRLFGWHVGLFPAGRSGLLRIRAGAWRDDATEPMQVVSDPISREKVHFEAPKADRLDGETAAFLEWFNGKDDADPILKAALAHLWFVTIHPFDDGNGRIARAIADMALARADGSPRRFYSMSARIRVERAAYHAILERSQKGTLNVTPWAAWFLGCLGRAIDGAETTLARVSRKAEFWRAHADEPFHDRQRKVLNRLFDGFEGKLTTTKWASLVKCSQDTAHRDILDLVRRGVLVKDAAGGRSTSYSLGGPWPAPSPPA